MNQKSQIFFINRTRGSTNYSNKALNKIKETFFQKKIKEN